MRSSIITISALFLAQPTSALPHHDGVVPVGDREFYKGELAQSFGDDAWSFNFRHAPWLKILLDNNPLLSDQSVIFFRSGVPATDLVGEFPTEMKEHERLEDDPAYMADGHDIVSFGDPYASNELLTARKYFPRKLPEISDNFEPIAARLIGIVVCLDVTDQSDA